MGNELWSTNTPVCCRVRCPTCVRVYVRHRHDTRVTFYILDIISIYVSISMSCPVFVFHKKWVLACWESQSRTQKNCLVIYFSSFRNKKGSITLWYSFYILGQNIWVIRWSCMLLMTDTFLAIQLWKLIVILVLYSGVLYI